MSRTRYLDGMEGFAPSAWGLSSISGVRKPGPHSCNSNTSGSCWRMVEVDAAYRAWVCAAAPPAHAIRAASTNLFVLFMCWACKQVRAFYNVQHCVSAVSVCLEQIQGHLSGPVSRGGGLTAIPLGPPPPSIAFEALGSVSHTCVHSNAYIHCIHCSTPSHFCPLLVIRIGTTHLLLLAFDEMHGLQGSNNRGSLNESELAPYCLAHI